MSAIFLNVSSVPFFVVAFALIPGVLFLKRISSEISRKDFVNQIAFLAVAVAISIMRGAILARWLYIGSVVAIWIAKVIAGRHRRKLMSAFR